MKKTFKYFALAVLCTIAFSCAKEESRDIVNEENNVAEEQVTPAIDGNLLTSFGVSFENDVDAPATCVSVNLADGITSIENGDEVLVFVDKNNYAIYTYDNSSSKFVLKNGENPVSLDGPASVFYPEDEFDVEGTGVKFTMPSAIEASEDFGAINPMVGRITGLVGAYTVELQNLISVLKVHVDADVNINSVTLEYGSGLNYASGSRYYINSSSLAMDYSDASAATSETCSLATPAKSAEVLFLMPTLELTNGLTVTANLAEAPTSRSLYKAAYTPGRNKISDLYFAAFFSGGRGTEASPYRIADARDFKNIQKLIANGLTSELNSAHFQTAHYKQTANILTGLNSITPVGTSSAPFSGVYDGGSKTLNVEINTTTDNTGVFGYIQDATIKNLTVSGIVQSSGVYTGGIVGQMAGSSQLLGCTNTATITNTNGTNSYVAGIVGRALNTSEIISCVNEGYIKADKPFCAGIAGDMTGTIDMCINKGSIEGTANTGGITGALRASSTVRRCYSAKNKTIKGTNRVGGIVGNNAGTVANCFSNSDVTGTSNTAEFGVGGLVGILGGGLVFNSATGDITVICSADCTNKDDAKVNVGGLVGRQTGGTIQNVYSPLFAKDIKIGSIHGRSGSGKIGQIVGVVTTSGSLCAYYFGGCSEATTGWQYWGTNDGQSSPNYEGQWAFTSANSVSMDWTAPVAKNFSGFGQSLTSGSYHLKDVLNIDKSSGAKYSAYTPAEGEVITWSDLSASDYHAIPDALKNLGSAYYSE